jgi:hypothetical protein
MAMTENELAIRRLLSEPSLPVNRVTPAQVSNAMLREIESDGQLSVDTAQEMKKQLADQIYMDTRLRGVSDFSGMRSVSTPRPEDNLYSDASKAASLALRSELATAKAEADRRKREPAAPDYTDERLRDAQEIGFPADGNDVSAVVEEEAKKIWELGRFDRQQLWESGGEPFTYEQARRMAWERVQDALSSPADTPGTLDYDPERRVPQERKSRRPRRANLYDPDAPEQTAEPPPPASSTGPWELLNSPKASPIPPPESTDRGIPRRSEASDAREAAMRALAKRRGRRENSR